MKLQKNKIKTIIFSTLLFLVVLASPLLTSVKAQSNTGSFSVEGATSAAVNTNFTISVYANSTGAYNALTTNVVFTNLTYVSSTVNSSVWQGISGPTLTGDTLSFSGAKLGTTVTGKQLVLSIVVKKITSAEATATAAGQMSFPTQDGSSSTTIDVTGNTLTIVTGGTGSLPNSGLEQIPFALGAAISASLIGAGVIFLVYYKNKGKLSLEEKVSK